jgi:hypothetical protein
MSHAEEWHLRLGPLSLGIGLRAIELTDAFPRLDPFPRRFASGALSHLDPRVVGKIRVPDDSVLDWESEGGALD